MNRLVIINCVIGPLLPKLGRCVFESCHSLSYAMDESLSLPPGSINKYLDRLGFLLPIFYRLAIVLCETSQNQSVETYSYVQLGCPSMICRYSTLY